MTDDSQRLRVTLVANTPTHYRLPLYEALQKRVQLSVVFYSDGGEWYWNYQSTPSLDTLNDVVQLRGRWVGKTRITPGLVLKLIRTPTDVIVKDPNGKFALPVTYLAARLRRKPFIFWASLWEHPTHGLHRITRPLSRYIYRHSDAILTYGHHVSRYVIAEGADPDRVIVAPQATATSQAPMKPTDFWDIRPIRLLYVGRLESWKGLNGAIRALAGLMEHPWTFTVAGEGSEREALQALVDDLGLTERVSFVGHLAREEVTIEYRDAAVVIIPSIRTTQVTEVWSLVVNEAMQSGALVVASSAVGAVADGLVADGVTGKTFHEGDIQDLTRCLADVFSDITAAKACAARGQAAIRNFTHEAAAAAFEEAARLVTYGFSRTGRNE